MQMWGGADLGAFLSLTITCVYEYLQEEYYVSVICASIATFHLCVSLSLLCGWSRHSGIDKISWYKPHQTVTTEAYLQDMCACHDTITELYPCSGQSL
jgi:hypothetical protein